MGGATVWMGMRAVARGATVAAFALAAGACGTVENMLPDPRDFHLPEAKNYTPTAMSAYARPVSATGQVGAADLVDGQGLCPGVAPVMASNDSPPDVATPTGTGSVALEMSECQVARALGPPQQAEIASTPQGAHRRLDLSRRRARRHLPLCRRTPDGDRARPRAAAAAAGCQEAAQEAEAAAGVTGANAATRAWQAHRTHIKSRDRNPAIR